METVGKRIKRMREERHMSQQALADLLGVSSRAIGNWENDKNLPRSLGAIEAVFRAPVEAGDPVVEAVRSSSLREWRQDAVLSIYKRNLHEQKMEEAG